jgi:multicomponent Na+:H+ antiporter subunit E
VLALGLFWLALSQRSEPVLLFFGVLSVLATLWVAARLELVGRDASPYHRTFHFVVYGGWLLGEIVKANIAVARRILGPSHTLTPAMERIPAAPVSGLGRAVFANSITLTPGTVTVELENAGALVHALDKSGAEAAAFARMNAMAAWASDPRPRKDGDA